MFDQKVNYKFISYMNNIEVVEMTFFILCVLQIKNKNKKLLIKSHDEFIKYNK
jgi:hypothetical protein